MKAKRSFSPRQPEPTATPLSLRTPADLSWDVRQVELAIARRAYELFVVRGGEHGHDWEDWFRAESEILRPVSISVSESDDCLSLCANVLGFEETELNISVEPCRVTILGHKEMSTTETEGGKVEYIDWSPNQILRVIALPAEVVPENARVELQAGLLRFELPKARPSNKESSAA